MRNLVGKVLADTDGKGRVETLLEKQKQRAAGVVEHNRDVVEALRDALMERDELVGEEIVAVIGAALKRRDLDPSIVTIPDPEPTAP